MNTQIPKRGEVLNDNPNIFVQKPRTTIDFLFPDTPEQIDLAVAESIRYKQKHKKFCPHCHKEL